MTPYYSDEWITIYNGDCREVMPELSGIETCITDPPYGLAFMGKDWDYGVPGVEFWQLVIGALLPGASCLAFGGTRTHHRLMCAIEDAGFELRDCLMWLYGSGFPKSFDLSKGIDRQRHDRGQVYLVTAWLRDARDAAGIGNAEIDAAFGFNGMAGHWTSNSSQPAVPTLDQVPRLLEILGEPEVPADIRELIWTLNGQKGEPGEAWFRREVLGTRDVPLGYAFAGATYGGDSSVVSTNDTAPATDAAKQWDGWGTALKPAWEPIVMAMKPLVGTFARNGLRYGVAGLNVDGARVGTEGRFNPPTRKGATPALGSFANCKGNGSKVTGRWPANVVLDEDAARQLDEQSGERGGGFGVRGVGGTVYAGGNGYSNTLGETGQTVGFGDSGGASRFFYTAKASASDRGENNNHPTVKPSDLMKWLSVLTKTPTAGTVLDPFMGSGTTIFAAKETGRRAIGIELDERYCEVAASRCAQGVLDLVGA